MPKPRNVETNELLDPGPIRLAEHQRRIINEALSKDDKGLLKYSTVLYSAPKKSGKSALASAITLYRAMHMPYEFCYCLANDGTSSKDRIYGPIKQCIMLHNRLGGILKGIRPNLVDVELPNFATIRAIPVDPAGEAGSQPAQTTWCYDEETEILTRDGWKYWNELSLDDYFGTLNPETEEFEWQKADALNISDYEGDMIEYDHRLFNFKVTPNHRMYGKLQKNKQSDISEWDSKTAEDIIDGDYLHFYPRLTSEGEFQGEFPDFVQDGKITMPGTKRKPDLELDLEYFVELLALFLAEGCINYKKGKPDCVMIGVSKEMYPDNYARIVWVLAEMGLRPTIWKNNDCVIFYDIRLTKYFAQFGKAPDKFIPEWVKNLPKKYLDIFVSTYLQSDGWVVGKTFKFGTISKKMDDDLCEIGLKLGYRVTSYGYPDERSQYLQRKISFISKSSDTLPLRVDKFNHVPYKGKVFCPSTKNGIVCVRRNGILLYGYNSEVWGFMQDNKRLLFSEMTIPPTLWGYSQRWIESYAGYIGQSELLWELYQMGTEEEHGAYRHPDFPDLPVWVNPSANMFTYWDTEPRMIWQTEDYYNAERKMLIPSEFRRLHQNQWVETTDSFISHETWIRCADNELPALDGRTPAIVAIDAAVMQDCSALVLVTRHPDYPATDVAVRKVAIFTPKGGGGKIDLQKTVAKTLIEWGMKYNIVSVVYDERHMEKMAQDFRRGNVTLTQEDIAHMTPEEIDAYIKEVREASQRWFKKFGQNAPRNVADKRLHDMIMQRQLAYNPDEDFMSDRKDGQESLTRHIVQAGLEGKGDKMRIVKVSNEAKIDATIALSMAVDVCMKLNLDNNELDTKEMAQQLARGDITWEEFQRRMTRRGVIRSD